MLAPVLETLRSLPNPLTLYEEPPIVVSDSETVLVQPTPTQHPTAVEAQLPPLTSPPLQGRQHTLHCPFDKDPGNENDAGDEFAQSFHKSNW